eukprot:TRINITY_DN6959_c0_g1_i4.p1 TRINITY_DN6959_c0_g1~~TRINITY_DN6959_c0_g1_i4.p1  ORF type:complete len:181 (-),score=40.97 TRINITY_DN6959_c0_g1_i4:7-549(-)
MLSHFLSLPIKPQDTQSIHHHMPTLRILLLLWLAVAWMLKYQLFAWIDTYGPNEALTTAAFNNILIEPLFIFGSFFELAAASHALLILAASNLSDLTIAIDYANRKDDTPQPARVATGFALLFSTSLLLTAAVEVLWRGQRIKSQRKRALQIATSVTSPLLKRGRSLGNLQPGSTPRWDS